MTRRVMDKVGPALGLLAVVGGLVVLLVLIGRAVIDSWGVVDWQFLTSFPSRNAEKAGILSAWVGSGWVLAVTGMLAVPLGIATGIYLEEYARDNWLTKFLEINIANLAGVPSVVYGILGLGLFVRALAMGRSVLAGGATLALLVLPMVILAARESLRAVPASVREASYALGATRWQTTWNQVLPAAGPGILTGVILAMSRAVGETAPLVMIGALTYVAFLPTNPLDSFTVLPIQIFNWVSRPQKAFLANAAGGVVVLLGLTLLMNSVAIVLRQRFHKHLRW